MENEPSMSTLLAVLGATTIALLALTEHFRDLPGAVVAFASARYILRLT